MICSECGHDNTAKVHTVDPWCMYQVKDGKVVNAMFLPDRIPEGWYDSPKAAKAALEVEEPEPGEVDKVEPDKVDGRTKAGKAEKARLNDYSSGTD